VTYKIRKTFPQINIVTKTSNWLTPMFENYSNLLI